MFTHVSPKDRRAVVGSLPRSSTSTIAQSVRLRLTPVIVAKLREFLVSGYDPSGAMHALVQVLTGTSYGDRAGVSRVVSPMVVATATVKSVISDLEGAIAQVQPPTLPAQPHASHGHNPSGSAGGMYRTSRPGALGGVASPPRSLASAFRGTLKRPLLPSVHESVDGGSGASGDGGELSAMAGQGVSSREDGGADVLDVVGTVKRARTAVEASISHSGGARDELSVGAGAGLSCADVEPSSSAPSGVDGGVQPPIAAPPPPRRPSSGTTLVVTVSVYRCVYI